MQASPASSPTEHPDSHYQHLASALPDWLGQLSPAHRQALKASAPQLAAGLTAASSTDHQALKALTASHWTAHSAVEQRLAHLQDASAFAEPLLRDALKSRLNLDLDVRNTFLRLYIKVTVPGFAITTGARTWTVSLLDAALHNFEEQEGDTYESTSTFITAPTPSGQFDTLPLVKKALGIPAFIKLCRELDIGAQYEAYLKDSLGFSEPVGAAVLRLKIQASEQAALQAAVQYARMNGDINEAYARLIGGLADGLQGMRINGQALRCHTLTMMSARLTGILVFATDLEARQPAGAVVAYIPDDPEHPIKQYASSQEMANELLRQLRSKDYQKFFSRFVDHERLGEFFANLNHRLSEVTWHEPVKGSALPPWRDEPIATPNLQIVATPLHGELWQHHYQPPLRHNGHGAWQTSLDQPLTWDRDTVVRRLGHSVQGLNRAEREQVLRISGFHDNVLREAHVDHRRPPSLLTDTLKRVKIDRDIRALLEQPEHPEREEALSQPLSFFEARYRELEHTEDRDVRLLQGVERGLPRDIAEELVDNATGSELQQLHAGKVPRRLRDVAIKAMEAVRTARAFEGFYLRSGETVDTWRLALHSLELLHGWPGDLRLELRAYSASGEELDSIGPQDAPIQKTLVCEADGSVHLAPDSAPAGTFYQAILNALSKAQRHALRLADSDGVALRQRIIDQATRTPSLRTLLAKHPQRKTLYDPTTMRLPGGTEGYFRSTSPTPTLEMRVREVYPNLDPQELRAMVLRLQRHPDGARMALSRLASESDALNVDLQRWVAQAPTVNAQTGLPLEPLERRAMRHNRRLLAEEIQRSWQRQSERDVDAADGSQRYRLSFREPIPGDLPTLRADFSHVTTLALTGDKAAHGLPDFLQSFTGLRRLELHGFKLDSLPPAIGQNSQLHTLILSDCGIALDGQAWKSLASLSHLKQLDLAANRFDHVPSIDSLSALEHLDLSNTVLTALPHGTWQHPQLKTLLLMNNAIGDVPMELFESAVYERRGLNLANNPLDEASWEQIKQQYFETSYDLGVAAPEADVQRVMALYPTLDATQASDFVYELPGTFTQGRSVLDSLEQELSRLSQDLDNWATELPQLHPQTGEALDAGQLFVEHLNRERFMQQLLRCWRHETELDGFDDRLEPTYELSLDVPILGELPTLRADFSHVSVLDLRGVDGLARLGRFLDAFAHLKRLRLRNFDLGNIPSTVFKLGRLYSLALPNCGIRLTEESANALAGLELLDYLDLASNPLGRTPDLSQMPDLINLLLDHTGITELPNGLLNRAELHWADLSNNAITEVPSDILEMPTALAENLHLRNNPLSEAALQRLVDYYERTGISFSVDAVNERGESPPLAARETQADE